MYRHEPNRWKGFILGTVGGAVGVIAMRYYWQAVSALIGKDPRTETRDAPWQRRAAMAWLGLMSACQTSQAGSPLQQGSSSLATS